MFTQIEGLDATASRHPRRKTYGVKVDTCAWAVARRLSCSPDEHGHGDIGTTLKQTLELARRVRSRAWTVNVPESGCGSAGNQKADAGRGLHRADHRDFINNGHVLLTKYPECAKALDKYRSIGKRGRGAAAG